MALAWHSEKCKSRTPIASPVTNPMANSDEAEIKKRGIHLESPAGDTLHESQQQPKSRAPAAYWPEPVFDVVVAAGTAFGTLKYPVAVVLLTLLITNSTAWRVPPV
jgi:hypothetical protein